MTNTQLRFLSAGIMLAVIGLCLYLGSSYALALIGLAGALIVDEIVTNFAGHSRGKFTYLVSQLTFVAGFIYFNYIDPMPAYFGHFITGGIVLNFLLIINLFCVGPQWAQAATKVYKAYSFLTGFLVLVMFMNLANILHRNYWQLLICALILLNYSVDTFAWFFGKKFGKRKLMPSVSPKKTLEGAVGGAASSFILILTFWTLVFAWPNAGLMLGFFFLSSVSQLGDLVQSKLKRQFEIKDSSAIIPGHGGVYDRFDSLLFVAPFYALLLNSFFVA